MGDKIELTLGKLLEEIAKNEQSLLQELKLIIGAIALKWNWGDPETVDDITQDCFLKLLNNISQGKFRGDSSLKTYVYALARNTCVDYYKEQRAIELIDIENADIADRALTAEERLEINNRRRLACKVLLSMSEDCRKLWRTIFFGKHNYRDAGKILELSEGTVKRRMWECRQQAGERLKSLEIGEP